MEGFYPVIFEGENVGEVQLQKKGLYYYLSCCCRLRDKAICMLCADCGEQQVQFGTLVPENEFYILKMHIQASRLSADHIVFYLKNKIKISQMDCVLEVGKSVSCLDKLECASFQREGAVCGINFTKNCR